MGQSVRQQSFDAIVADVAPHLSRYLRRFVGDRTAAEDLLQETLIRMAKGLPEFAGRASVKTWAFTIATRVAADYFRRPDRRAGIVEIEEAEEVPDSARLMDERMVIDEMNACIRQVIDSLPEDYRAAVVLHDLEGLTAQQIADVCGESVATVKIRIHRARRRLKQALSRRCDFYHDDDNIFRCDRKAEPRT